MLESNVQWATKVMPLLLCISYGSRGHDFGDPLYSRFDSSILYLIES